MGKNLEEKTLFSGEKVKVVGAGVRRGDARPAPLLEGQDPEPAGDAQVPAERRAVLVQQGMVREREAQDPGMKTMNRRGRGEREMIQVRNSNMIETRQTNSKFE